MPKELVNRAAEPAIGGAPYGDMAEVSGQPTVDLVFDTYREFLATDARSILCLLFPHHYNFILNPAMRTNANGWSVSGAPAAPTPASYEVAATTDAVANSEAMVNTRAAGIDGQIVNVNETVDKPGLTTALARWGAPSKPPLVYNLLTANQASLETNTAGWAVEMNCTIARSTAQAADGTACLSVTATATATSGAITTTGTGGIPVVPGRSYTATVAVRAATTARNPTLAFAWYTSAGTFISKTGGWSMLEVNNAWTTGTSTQVAPATAAYAAVSVTFPSAVAAEVHYIDKIGFWDSVGGAWSLPGTPIVGVVPDRVRDLTGGGNDLVFATTPNNAPVVHPWTGKNYLSVYTGVANSNYLDGIIANVPATATMSWDIETGPTIANANFILLHAGANNGEVQVFITNAGAFYVSTRVAGVTKSAFWNSAVTTYSRKTYRVALTTTGATLYIDDVSQGLVSFGATRIPATNTTSTMFMADSVATASWYRIHSFNLYGAQVFDPVKANVDATFTTVTNTGNQGGIWTVRRAATGYKAVLVTEPMLNFGGVQSMQTANMMPLLTGTFLMSLRHHSDSSLNSLSKADTSAAVGFQQQILTSGKYQFKMGAATWTSPAAIPAGPHVIGITYDGSTAQVYIDGAIQSGFSSTGNFLNNMVFIGSTAWASMHWTGAAVWDRVLTPAEVAAASADLAGGSIADPETNTYSYVLTTGQTIAKATVPFPVTGDLVGYRLWVFGDSLDSTTSWVGKSFHLSGSGAIAFNDTKPAVPPGPYGVYVGVSKDILTDNWYEPGRNSAQWTFSAYVMGPCKARLTMEAYAPTDPLIAYSPPKYWGLKKYSNPGGLLYNASEPAVVDSATGNVWLLKSPPFYKSLGRLIRITSPSTWVPPAVVPEYILEGATANVWKVISPLPTSGARYALKGTYVDKTPPWDPYLAPPVEAYARYVDAVDLIDNETIWEAMTSVTAPGLTYYGDTGEKAAIGSVSGEMTYIRDGEWTRLILQTGENSGHNDSNSFLGCGWIVARLEFEEAENARFSAFMLDPTEHPIAQYFDGGMTEDTVLDDFMWARNTVKYPGDVNNSVSEYYYDRLTRVRFLSEHLRDHVPTGRPYQIFMGSFDDPYVPPENQETPQARNLHRKI